MAKRIHTSRRPGRVNTPAPSEQASRKVSHRGAGSSVGGIMAPRTVTATPERVQSVRELFWQNVMREMLVSLVMVSLRLNAKGGTPAEPDASEEALDGRLGLITSQGQRIPIARVFPMFSATVGKTPTQITLSVLLECTVFQVHTPGGEVYTLPLQEIRGFHSLTAELMEQLKQNARGESGENSEREPFGFAAFTSLARTKLLADTPQGEGAD